MKICLYSNNFLPLLGGMENVSLILAEQWTQMGHDVLVASNTPAPDGYDQRFPFRVFRLPRASDWRQLLAGRDVLISTGANVRFVSEWIRSGVPFGWSHHESAPFAVGADLRHRIPPQNWLWAQRSADFEIAASGYLKSLLKSERVHVVLNGIDSVFRSLPGVVRGPDILFYGRLTMDKGLDTIVEAMAILKARGRGLRVRVIGSGGDAEAMAALAQRSGVADLLLMEGGLRGEALVHAVCQSRAVLVPSRRHEVFGLVVAEAMACGRCVIASRDGGIPEVAGEAALMFEPRDAHTLANLMYVVSYDDELVSHFEALGLERAKHFTARRMAEEYLAVMQDAVEARKRHRLRVSLKLRRSVLVPLVAVARQVRPPKSRDPHLAVR